METPSAIPRRLEVISDHKEGGGFVAAVLPIHYPRGLLRAFDILPVEIWGPPKVDASYGAAHLQPYVCSIVRNALSFLQTGGLDVADFLIVPHACDSLQGLGSLLIDFVNPDQPVFPIYIPRGERESDIDFLADEFRDLYRQLTTKTGRGPSEADLLESIHREEEADQLLSDLHGSRERLPLTDAAFYRLVRSREYLPAEMFAELAQGAAGQSAETRRDGVPILISGIVPEPMALLEAITEMGGAVVADDLASCGRRLYPRGRSVNPFRRMAERILQAPPDSTRASSIHDRTEHLLDLVRTFGAKGVIFYDVKFCEPELFDIPALRRELQDSGIPSVVVEVDIGDPLSHRILTRLEAFLEMIR
ncbi:MAG: 2-hydroxyacyl-CoA dehydratase family protein [Anaerolineae bacterium]|jgi:benzoyl-CoA reductase/2-hydroxyglutaryl-CoA dehydratase subunit BcrC/BadD/HgdB